VDVRAAPPPSAAITWVGPICAVVGALGFSFKAILIKLAYAWAASDPIVLLTLRMLYSAPFFVLMAFSAGRRAGAAPLRRRDWLTLVWLGFVGYYLASLLDFVGLQYVSAGLERLVLFLYPTIVVVLSALFLGKKITGREMIALSLSYVGIGLAFAHDLRVGSDTSSVVLGAALVFGSAIAYAAYLVGAGPILARIGSQRFIAWAMLLSTVFVVGQFVLTRPLEALAVPLSIHALSLAMAIFSTVLPTWLVAEAVRRIGANRSALIGSLGPVFTIALGALILAEPVNAMQLVGAVLVLVGVILVSLKSSPQAKRRI
jgi:drug/metabolite transporter (DMT)-like permease